MVGGGCPQKDGSCLEGRIDGLQQLTGGRGEGQEVAWTDRQEWRENTHLFCRGLEGRAWWGSQA